MIRSLVLLAACLAVAQATVLPVSGSVHAEVLGQSGKIRLYDSDTGSTLQIKWNKIEEIATNGQKVAFVNNMASQDFTVSNPTLVPVNGKNATKITLSVPSLNVASGNFHPSLSVDVFIYQQETTVQNGNQTLTVLADQLKFTINMAGWQFSNAANTLHFGLQVLEKGDKDPSSSTVTAKNSDEKTVKFDSGNLDLATEAVIDGHNVAITSTVTKVGQNTVVDLTFPSFTSTLSYDPTLSLNGSPNSASTLAASAMALLMAVAVFLF